MVNFRRDISYSSDDSKESLRGSAISKLVAVPKGIVKYWPDITEKLHIDIVLDKRRETRLIDRLGRNGLKRVFECVSGPDLTDCYKIQDDSTYLEIRSIACLIPILLTHCDSSFRSVTNAPLR